MLLLSTSSLKGYGIHKIFILTKKAKFDGIDLVIEKNNFDSLDENYLKTLSDAFELPILSITPPDKGLDKQKVDKIVKMAEVLKTQVINFYPPHFSDKNTDWYFKYLNKIKKEKRISISIQNVKQKMLYFIIPEYKNSNLIDIRKITGDTTLNIANIDKSTGIDLLKAQSILGNTITNVFLSDKSSGKDGLLPGNAGGGVSYLPLESFLMKMKVNGYNGFFTLKVKPQELGAGSDEKVLFSLEGFKKYYNKHFLEYKA